MAHGDLEPLTRAALARAQNKLPLLSDLSQCKALRWKGADTTPINMQCWNGKRPDRPQCDFVGSQNIPVYAMTGLARWDFHVVLAKCWQEEGMFGMELGSPGSFYYRGVLGCMATAYNNLPSHSSPDLSDIHLAIRSAAAWDTMTALFTPRLSDEIHYSDKVTKATNPLGKSANPLCVAVSGMRWSEKAQDRTSLTSEDSHSEFLLDVINGKIASISPSEIDLIRHAINGDKSSAKTVSSWMFGTIHTPDKTWKWRLRRTSLGTESVFLGNYPNSMKPMRVVTQLTKDGRWVGMRPSPEDSPNKWADGFTVSIENGVINSSGAAGSASLPELSGDIIWECSVEGESVSFN